ncbi:MAG: hypothetical protein P3W89_000195 [Aquificaceae bacterium]|nr:hypothetical protein [Aquificaceae bacterium]
MIVPPAYAPRFGWGLVASVVSLLTAYYVFREGCVMFLGKERHQGVVPHESPGVMLVPMVVLSIMAVVAGFFEGWYSQVFGAEKELHLTIAVLSVAIGLTGIAIAYVVYLKGILNPEKAYEALKPLHTTFKEQFFTERLYHKVLAKGYMSLSRVLYATAERQLIDGLVNSSYVGVRALGGLLKALQAGKLNLYILFLSVGFLALLFLVIFWR